MALTDHPRPVSTAPGIRRVVALIVGDTLAFLAFAALGRASHSEAAGIDAIVQVAETAAPFVAGWFAIAPFVGAFKADVAARPRAMLSRTALAWLIAWPVGLGLRAMIRQTGIPTTFAVITLVTNLLILIGWRGAFAWLARRASAR